jgi:Peptidase family M28
MLKWSGLLLCLWIFLALPGYGQGPPPLRPVAPLSTLDDFRKDFVNVPCKNSERSSGVRALFQKNGVPGAGMSLTSSKGPKNYHVFVKGKSDEIIVVGAHYDLVEKGCGAIDIWTGIVVIARIYGSLKGLTPEKTIEFVAFDQEEEGLLGSQAFVQAIGKQDLSRYCAMINLDSFSEGAPFVMANASSDKLAKFAEEAARSLKIPFGSVSIPDADADSSSFLRRKIPAMTISGVTADWATILHTPNDQAVRVKPESVYSGYLLSMAVLQHVDQAPCGQFR